MEDNNKSLERLSYVIANAIVKSEDVKKILSELREKEVICKEGLMVLMIRMKALTDATEELKEVKKELLKKQKLANIQIDGKILTMEEIAFQEYCAEQFNDIEWLKNIKVNFSD